MTMTMPNEKKYLEAPQILEAFDEHIQKFKWRITELANNIEATAYRQEIHALIHDLNMQKHLNNKLEEIFKEIGVNPREHPAWVKR